MPDYFFDTTVLIAYLKREDARTPTLFEEVFNQRAVAAISVITVAELWANADLVNPEHLIEREALISLLQIAPLDLTLAQAAGTLRRQHHLDLPDALIAATCARVGGRFFSKDPHFNRLMEADVLVGEVYH